MEFTLRYGVSYKNVLTKLSLYSALSVLGCILLGYIFLPFAAAYYGALLTFENRGKRVMTYVLPAIFFTLNLIIRAAFSLEAVCYVILGAILYFAARKNWSKSETAVWMIAVTLILLSLSAVFIAFEKTGSIGFMPLKQFYSNIYTD